MHFCEIRFCQVCCLGVTSFMECGWHSQNKMYAIIDLLQKQCFPLKKKTSLKCLHFPCFLADLKREVLSARF